MGISEPIIHEATSVNPDPTKFMPIEVTSAFPEGDESKFTAEEKAQIEKFINEVPDKNDTRAINYWLDWGDRKVYLEGWIHQCLAGMGFPPMESGEWDSKIDHMVNNTKRTLIDKQIDRTLSPDSIAKILPLTLIEGGFREFEAGTKDWLYGVTWGVYKRVNQSPESLEAIATSIHPLVLEQFSYPSPDQMELGGDIGKIKVSIPPPRGSKLEEGSVIRTSEKHDKAIEHLGYHSVSLNAEEIASLETKVPTDVEIINESQRRLRETKVIPDDKLSPPQLVHINLARAIAREVGCLPPSGIHAAIIPPASARVRTAGLYGTKTGALYLSIDMLSKGRDGFDTLVHELGHHCQYTSTGETEDLTPSHAEAMKNIAEKLIQGLNSGKYDKLLVGTQY